MIDHVKGDPMAEIAADQTNAEVRDPAVVGRPVIAAVDGLAAVIAVATEAVIEAVIAEDIEINAVEAAADDRAAAIAAVTASNPVAVAAITEMTEVADRVVAKAAAAKVVAAAVIAAVAEIEAETAAEIEAAVAIAAAVAVADVTTDNAH